MGDIYNIITESTVTKVQVRIIKPFHATYSDSISCYLLSGPSALPAVTETRSEPTLWPAEPPATTGDAERHQETLAFTNNLHKFHINYKQKSFCEQ